MKDIIQYNEFIGSVHFNAEDEIFYGKIEGINDLITFEGSTVQELKKAFKEAVEDYLETCENLGKTPHKSFKGSFNIRIKPELHKLAHQLANIEGVSLNQLIQDAISHEIKQNKDKLKKAI
ncbi:MAG: type II toxin-antitoxin system HicB family antitoxin [Gammaproteobacteria bacterium]|nr:type II toxin-antitoxin system HicB family antitoxin [Gammaproteobacteria bacterium]